MDRKQSIRDGIYPLTLSWKVEDNVKVWLNPPYGQGKNSAKYWILKAIREYLTGNIQEVLLLVRGDSKAISVLMKKCYWIEFDQRISFMNSEGFYGYGAVPGIRLFYLGARNIEFYDHFNYLGTVCQKVERAQLIF